MPDLLRVQQLVRLLEKSQIRLETARVALRGYRAYFVEQWLAQRRPGCLILTFTGDQEDTLDAVQLLIAAERPLPGPFVAYLDFLTQLGTPTATDQGVVFITDLADLDAELFFVRCPNNDVRSSYQLYKVNYDLKVLGVASRAATTITSPSSTVETKLKQVFNYPDEVSIEYFVPQMICLTQVCLYYFNLLDLSRCDGLLCDETLAAIERWWEKMARVDTVLLLKQRGASVPIPVSMLTIVSFTALFKSTLDLGGNQFSPPKDILDVERFTHCVLSFQRQLRLTPTGFLNGETFTVLSKWASQTSTNSTFTKDLSKMKNMVKSTVNDLRNTSGSMGTSKKNGGSLTDFQLIKSCQDYDTFSKLKLGKRCQFLIEGKGVPFDIVEYIDKLAFKLLSPASLTHNSNNSVDSSLRTNSRPNESVAAGFRQFSFGNKERDPNSIYRVNHPLDEAALMESDIDEDHVEGFDYDHQLDNDNDDVKLDDNAVLYQKFTPPSGEGLESFVGDFDSKSSFDEVECSNFCKMAHDDEYICFKSRTNRRNSIPLVQSEMNINSIEPLKRNANNSNMLQRKNSRRYSTHSSLNKNNALKSLKNNSKSDVNTLEPIFIDDTNWENTSTNVNHEQGNNHSWITYQSESMYETAIEKMSLRRVQSLPLILHTDAYHDEFFGLRTSTSNYITSEVLAMKYLKMKVSYQTQVQQKFNLWKRDFQFIKDDITINSNTHWLFNEDQLNSPVSMHESSSIATAATTGAMLSKTSAAAAAVTASSSPMIPAPSSAFMLNRNASTNANQATSLDYQKVLQRQTDLGKKFFNVSESNNRLRYELQTLLRKTNDLESSVAQLKDLKMKTLYEKVDAISLKLDQYGSLSAKTSHKSEEGSEEDQSLSNANDDVIERICSKDGKVHWNQVQWDQVAMRPHVLIYIIFRWLAYLVCRLDNQFIEQQWAKIDRNNTVTKFFKEMYDKGERLVKGEKHKDD